MSDQTNDNDEILGIIVSDRYSGRESKLLRPRSFLGNWLIRIVRTVTRPNRICGIRFHVGLGNYEARRIWIFCFFSLFTFVPIKLLSW